MQHIPNIFAHKIEKTRSIHNNDGFRWWTEHYLFHLLNEIWNFILNRSEDSFLLYFNLQTLVKLKCTWYLRMKRSNSFVKLRHKNIIIILRLTGEWSHAQKKSLDWKIFQFCSYAPASIVYGLIRTTVWFLENRIHFKFSLEPFIKEFTMINESHYKMNHGLITFPRISHMHQYTIYAAKWCCDWVQNKWISLQI